MSRFRIALAVFSLPVLLVAEQGGFIAGVVCERSGSVIAGAEVRVQNEQTGARQKVYADSSGSYSSSELAPGFYKMTISSDGFRTSNRGGISIVGGKVSRLDFIIELLPLQQEITVTPAQSKDDPMVSGVTVSRDSDSGSLPANGRDVHALFSLMPGATITPASLSSGGQFTVGGQRPNANSFRVDGVSGNVGIGIVSVPGALPGGSLPAMTTVGGTQTLASKEETERVALRSADFSAEYGDRPGAQIDIETRSGSSDFHGSLFGYMRPHSLDSSDWFARGAAADLPSASDNGWGASLGGPLRHDPWGNPIYFFTSFEHADVHDSALQLVPVPNEAVRQRVGPYQAVFDAFPSPAGHALTTTESVGYSTLQKAASAMNASERIDDTIGSNVHLFGRFSYVPSVATSIELGTAYSAFNWMSATAGVNMSVGDVTQEGRVNYSRVSATAIHGPQDTPALDSIGAALQNIFPSSSGDNYAGNAYGGFPANSEVTQLTVGGIGQTIEGQAGSSSQRQWAIAYLIAKHTNRNDFRSGGDSVSLVPTFSLLEQSLAISSPGLNGLLAGVPLGLTNSAFGFNIASSQHWSIFAQDTLHLTDRLDLLLGLRWEFTPTPYSYGSQTTSYPYVGYWSGTGTEPVQLAENIYPNGPIWPMRYNQFAPRVGVAYYLRRPDVVIRAGAGIFYDTQMASIISNENPLTAWQYLPTSASPSTYSGELPNTPSTLYLPQVLEWRTTIEKSVGESSALSLSYVGSAGRRLLRNDATIDSQSNILQSLSFTSEGKSDYEALLAQFRGNITPRLYTFLSYTWSHSIDTGSSDTEPFLFQPGAVNENDRGSSSFDVRHVLTAALGYRVGARHSPLLRNWSISTTLFARTGFPFDVTTVDRSLGLGFDNSGRADLIPGRPIWIFTPSIPGGRELNPAAFAAPLSGRNGTLGRDVLTGPGLFQIDASLRRQFRLFRSISAEASISAFNLLNHPAFSNPVSYLGSALFGQSTSTANLMLGSGSPTTGLTPLYQAGGPRTVELGLRFTF